MKHLTESALCREVLEGSAVCTEVIDSTRTVQEIREAANGSGFKAEGRVHVCLTGREDADLALVTFPHLGLPRTPTPPRPRHRFSLFLASLCLQLETQADFVSAAVHVLAVEQPGEGELHSWGKKRGEESEHCSGGEEAERVWLKVRH